jgi:hypothetical protein
LSLLHLVHCLQVVTKKVEETTQEQVPTEEITQEVVDSTQIDTVATMVEPKDSISKP